MKTEEEKKYKITPSGGVVTMPEQELNGNKKLKEIVDDYLTIINNSSLSEEQKQTYQKFYSIQNGKKSLFG